MSVRLSGTQTLSRTANLPDDIAFTACGWARLVVDSNDFVTVCALESATADAGNFLRLQTDTDGTSLTYFTDSGQTGAQTLTVGTDFFWAITCSGLGTAAHVGYYRAAASTALSVLTMAGGSRVNMTPALLRFGKTSETGAAGWNGRLWNIKCWSRALTAAELLVESYFARVMLPTSINFHWPLKGVDDTRDLSGNGRTATLAGTMTTEDEFGLFVPRRQIFIPVTVSGDVTLALTGQALASAAGSLGPAASVALTGSALTAATGTVKPALSKALSGLSLSSAGGTISPSFSVALTGQALAMAQGTITVSGDLTLALTGQALTLAAGTLAPSTARALSGTALSASAGTLVPATSRALTGNAASLAPGSISPAIAKALSGNLLTGSLGTLTPVTGITIALTGQSLSLGQGSIFSALSVSLSGQSLSALTGSFGIENSSAVNETVPYLIEDSLADALMRIASIRCTANVIGSSGTVTDQDPPHMSVVARGTVITITLGGVLYTGGEGNSRSRSPYSTPDAVPPFPRHRRGPS